MSETSERLERMATYAINMESAEGFPVTAQLIRDKVSDLAATSMFAGTSADECEAISRRIIKLHDVTIAGPVVVKEKNHRVWLSARKSEITPYYWTRYEDLLAQKGLPKNVLGELASSSDLILDLMHDPKDESTWDRRGLVMGNVQSGKTQNYIGLITKAADAGYKVIIVIAGIHNNLRNQTQFRIDEGFVGQHWHGTKRQPVGVGLIARDKKPSSFTATNRDFTAHSAQSIGIPLNNLSEPAIFVIKKNSTTLAKLIEWLRDNNLGKNGKIQQPLLLIDDEADNASINIKSGDSSPSRINAQIRELLSIFDRSVYIGYTATPFANIFIDPDSEHAMLEEDLFPRSFIINLESPSNYFGAQKIFGDESQEKLTFINDFEDSLPLNHRKEFVIGELPESLSDAVRNFVLTRAIRILRGQGTMHSSMLVNVSRFVNIHTQLKTEIEILRKQIEAAVRIDGKKSSKEMLTNGEIRKLKEVFDSVYLASDVEETWGEVCKVLLEAVAPISVMEIHSKSDATLRYDDHTEHGLHVIAVGGFSLSRGLTLEGLTISYFLRNSIMYDTLLQMGRWFGYRLGYEDLCQIYLTEESADWYRHIAESVEELREDLRQMQSENLTPSDFGLKVRNHPDSLIVTARNKAGKSAEVILTTSWSNRFIETFSLSSKFKDGNLNVADELGRQLLELGCQITEQKDQSLISLSDVPHKIIIDFINKFSLTGEEKLRLEPGGITGYIKQNLERLAIWDVAIPTLQKASSHHTFMGHTINCQSRTVSNASIQQGGLSFSLSSRQMLASRGIEKVGLSDAEIKRALKQFDLENKQKELEGKDTTKNIPNRIYRENRSRPLLMLHFIQPEISDDPKHDRYRRELEKYRSEIDKKVFAAWGISFPNLGSRDAPVSYKVNTTWMREHLVGDLEEDELDD